MLHGTSRNRSTVVAEVAPPVCQGGKRRKPRVVVYVITIQGDGLFPLVPGFVAAFTQIFGYYLNVSTGVFNCCHVGNFVGTKLINIRWTNDTHAIACPTTPARNFRMPYVWVCVPHMSPRRPVASTCSNLGSAEVGVRNTSIMFG